MSQNNHTRMTPLNFAAAHRTSIGCALFLVLAVTMIPLPALADTPLPLNNMWTCPPPTLAADPTVPRPDAQGDRLYARVVDSAGNDFEIWCISTLTGFHYEYYRSYRSGKRTKLDECELFRGTNDIKLRIKGKVRTGGLVPGGGKSIRVKGRIKGYYHHNFNSSKDFHHIYDWATGKLRRINTKTVRGSNGKKYRKILSCSSSIVSLVEQPESVEEETIAFIQLADPDYSPPKLACDQAEAPPEVQLEEIEVALANDQTESILSTLYLSPDRINTREGALVIEYDDGDLVELANLALPNELVGNGDLAITLDGSPVEYESYVTDSCVVLSIPLTTGHHELVIPAQVNAANTRDFIPWIWALGIFLLGILVWYLKKLRTKSDI